MGSTTPASFQYESYILVTNKEIKIELNPCKKTIN